MNVPALKYKMFISIVPADEAWRVGFVKELLATRHGDLEVPGLLKTEMDEIMDYLCTQ